MFLSQITSLMVRTQTSGLARIDAAIAASLLSEVLHREYHASFLFHVSVPVSLFLGEIWFDDRAEQASIRPVSKLGGQHWIKKALASCNAWHGESFCWKHMLVKFYIHDALLDLVHREALYWSCRYRQLNFSQQGAFLLLGVVAPFGVLSFQQHSHVSCVAEK